jgi:hypothetical protein
LLGHSVITMLLAAALSAGAPIALHPSNPHYFLFRGKPTVLISSAEHYGAVLDLDFDYRAYVEALRRAGMNQSRCFSGCYCEDPASFGIVDNTLAPAEGRLISPWARSSTPGYAFGGNRFDLTRWDPAYFSRLTDYVRRAGRAGVVVELVLFCPFYEERMWELSPMNARNNVNGVGAVRRDEVLSLKHPALLEVQTSMTRRIVEALNAFDNVYFEICNEPYAGAVSAEWQRAIAETIVATESRLPRRHLIAQNIANGGARADPAHPDVRVLNFHYAHPPDAIRQNEDLARPICFDETGFRGNEDAAYRTEAWAFMLAGGAEYSMLDYSFTPRHPDGSGARTSSPGGGGPALRTQLRALAKFMRALPFVAMRPGTAWLGTLPAGVSASGLALEGSAYAAVVTGPASSSLALQLPAGVYRMTTVDCVTGAVDQARQLRHRGGSLPWALPHAETGLRIRAVRPGGAA